MKYSLGISNFLEEISSLFHSILFSVSLHCSLKEGLLHSPDGKESAYSQSGFFLGSPTVAQLSSVGWGTQGWDEKSEEVHGLKY